MIIVPLDTRLISLGRVGAVVLSLKVLVERWELVANKEALEEDVVTCSDFSIGVTLEDAKGSTVVEDMPRS